jgi:anti-sigma regulatory factor (Ser/Thr protein kinase)
MSQPHGRKPNPHFELKCCVDGSMLRPLREFVSNVARTLGFSEKQLGEIEICVDEACANAIEHAYGGEFEREFSSCERDLCIEIRFRDEELVVRVIDYGHGTDRQADQRLRGLEEYLGSEQERFRGLGLYLMNKFMDRVHVESEPGKGTTVEMTKVRR